MIIRFSAIDTLPPLAWIASHKRGSGLLDVVAGRRVSFKDGIFWEGVNACPADPKKIASHHFSLVTGGMADGNSAVFFTPGHVLDRLFFCKIKDQFYISNSLPFLLAVSSNELLPDYLHYGFHFRTMVENMQTIPARHGPIGLLTRANIRLDLNNNFAIEYKEKSPDFSSFESYIARIKQWLHELKEALDSSINNRFKPITTISSG